MEFNWHSWNALIKPFFKLFFGGSPPSLPPTSSNLIRQIILLYIFRLSFGGEGLNSGGFTLKSRSKASDIACSYFDGHTTDLARSPQLIFKGLLYNLLKVLAELECLDDHSCAVNLPCVFPFFLAALIVKIFVFCFLKWLTTLHLI